MDNRNSVHTKELAVCKPSPTGVHHWMQSIGDSPVFYCIYCGGFRAFNIRTYRFNPYRGEEFMNVFTLDTLPYLIKLLDNRHKDKEIEDNPNLTAPRTKGTRNSPATKRKKVKGLFDDGPKPRRVVKNGVMIFTRSDKRSVKEK